MKPENKGMLLGLIGVTLFGLTLPATRMALESFHPIFIATGRALLATVLAVIYLVAGKHRRPTLHEFKYLLLVVMGVAIGFPVFTALAMQEVDASHGGVMLGIMPLTVAACAAWLFKERPSLGFWMMALLGSTLVIVFSLMRGHGSLHWADLSLLLAVLTGSISYAAGGYLARSLGGIARVGQAQLLQPFVTIIASAWLLGEVVDWVTWTFAIVVFAVVALGRVLGAKR